MRFDAENIPLEKMFGRGHASVWDLRPTIREVRLTTPGGAYALERGREKRWPALWDTGAVLTVIPRLFVDQIGYPPSGKTKPLSGFDPSQPKRPYDWYYVRIGLPGLPLYRIRVIAPDDSSRPTRERRKHILLGRDLALRLVVKWSSNVPWNDQVPILPPSTWTWSYRRLFPRGLPDIMQ